MAVVELKVEMRENTGHKISKALREEGRVPAIFYAQGEASVLISINEKDINQLIRKEVNVLDVVFPKGEPRKSIVRDIQYDPVTDAVLHVDLMGIKLTEKIRISIPVVLIGTPAGVKEGGILEHPLREVEVEGLPLEIPEHLEVDVSQMNIGDSLTLENIPVEKISFITDIRHPVAHVIHPKVVEEVVAVVEGEEPTEGEKVEGKTTGTTAEEES